MSVSHVSQDEPPRVDVWTVLKELPQRVQALLKASQELGFKGLEQELHALFTHAECAATSEALERQDVDLPHVFIDAEKHHRAYRCEKTYLCAVGPVTAMRTLYRARPGERAVAAMERKVRAPFTAHCLSHVGREGRIPIGLIPTGSVSVEPGMRSRPKRGMRATQMNGETPTSRQVLTHPVSTAGSVPTSRSIHLDGYREVTGQVVRFVHERRAGSEGTRRVSYIQRVGAVASGDWDNSSNARQDASTQSANYLCRWRDQRRACSTRIEPSTNCGENIG